MLKRVLMVLVIFPAVSFALQKITLQEGVATPITIANHALNHFSVENDRIVSVKGGVTGIFEHDFDEKLGHVYLKPILEEYLEPIHIFINTEKEKTLSLLLNPTNIQAESLHLAVEGTNYRKPDAWEKTNDYESVITKMIKAMHNKTPLEGFAIYPAKPQNSKPKVKTKLQKRLLAVYQGENLIGETWLVENRTGKIIILSERDFYDPGVRAVAILYKSLSNKGLTSVYRVIANG